MRRRKTRPPPDLNVSRIRLGSHWPEPVLLTVELEAVSEFVKHRRNVLGGTLWTYTASGFCRGKESTSGGTGVRRGPRERAQDAALRRAAGLPARASGEAAQAGAVAGRDRRHSERRPEPTQETTTHGQADLRPPAGGARLRGRLHCREGLCAAAARAQARDVRAADARARRGASRFRRSPGGAGRSGAESALLRDGPAAFR